MGEFIACRVCLSTDVKLYDMFINNLVFPYEKLTGNKVSRDGSFSHSTCGVCSTLILKCNTFRELCRSSQDLIQFALDQNHVITAEYIRSLDLKTHSMSNLTVHRVVGATEPVEYEVEIKEESPTFNDDWKGSSDDETPDRDTRIDCVVLKVEKEEKVEKQEKVEPDDAEEEGPDNKAPGADEEQMEVLILTKEQQIEEMQARKSSLNYMNSFYKCQKCFKGFLTDATYRNHMARHDPAKGPRVCDVCFTYWPNMGSLNAHVVTSHERKYICRLCTHISNSKHKAKEHVRWHNGHVYNCKICGATFEKSTSHLTHVRLQHPSGHSCEFCGESFISAHGLRMHKRKAHGNVEKEVDHPCATCGTRFQSRDELRAHLKDSENTCVNSWSCVHCDKTFKKESYLKEHSKVHSKTDRLKCKECDRSFATERRYAIHKQRVHVATKGPFRRYCDARRPVVCEVCGKKCLTNAAFICHQRIHTGEKPFQCSECPKKFSVHQRLQIHMRTHTGECPYQCSHCPKAFKHKAALNRHQRVHTGEKPYTCSHCGKCFSQSNSMKMHVKTVHLKIPAPARNSRRREKVIIDCQRA